MSHHPITHFKICDEVVENHFEYRGVRFVVFPQFKGFWGHYRTWGKLFGVKIFGATRKELIKNIDAALAHSEKSK